MINKYNSFGLVKDLENLVGEIFDGDFHPHVWSYRSNRAATIKKEEDKYLLQVEVPGYNKNSLEIKVIDSVLRVLSKEDQKELCQTALDKSVDIDKIKARTEEGMLYVTLPKTVKSSGKVIKVEEWGLLGLAKKIDNYKKAFFIHFKFEGNKETVSEFEKKIKLDNSIIRHLTVRYKKLDTKNEFFNKKT